MKILGKIIDYLTIPWYIVGILMSRYIERELSMALLDVKHWHTIIYLFIFDSRSVEKDIF